MAYDDKSNVLSERSESKHFYIYILRTDNNQLYIGHTNNVNRRELEHEHFHHGAKFIKDNRLKFEIVYTEKFSTRAEAMKREKQLKGWTRVKKEALIAGDFKRLKEL